VSDVVLKSREVQAAGDRVMVNMFADFTSRVTNRTVSTSMVELYSFKEGRITQIDVYYNDVTKRSVLYAER
jgi:ketosteroid isomerase-like protein